MLDVAGYCRGVGRSVDAAAVLEEAAVLQAASGHAEAARAALDEAVAAYNEVGATSDILRSTRWAPNRSMAGWWSDGTEAVGIRGRPRRRVAPPSGPVFSLLS